MEECTVSLCILGLLRGNEIYDMASTKSFIIKIIQVSYVHVNSSNIYGASLSMHLWILIIPEKRINLRGLLLDLAGNESPYIRPF